ncbi:unnamed protein product [Timema podura]|uniref:Uncharacterized protein n=1 Tax=Timema podura TaxID=61482 RepID=A0ABN7P9E4_TIMPD|nr:unnamed protein product [Timema podura]
MLSQILSLIHQQLSLQFSPELVPSHRSSRHSREGMMRKHYKTRGWGYCSRSWPFDLSYLCSPRL